MAKNGNISVFVPHIGCSNRCSFCNQIEITGRSDAPTSIDVLNAVDTAKKSYGYDPKSTELAFFGGSFTAIDRAYMLSLLEAGYRAYTDGDICGIRISTRPDAIDKEILTLLKKYAVTSIELGAQSLNENVLEMNKRGHTAKDVEKASRLIKEYGFGLGLQMMTGLYGSTFDEDIRTAEAFVSLKPDTVRIYPTMVLKNTLLEKYYIGGIYKPETLDSAVELCAKLLRIFYSNGINVIRTGLHTIDESAYVAGPWHPAFGEMVLSRYYLSDLEESLFTKPKGMYTIKVNCADVSRFVGHKKCNVEHLAKLGYIVKIASGEVERGNFIIE